MMRARRDRKIFRRRTDISNLDGDRRRQRHLIAGVPSVRLKVGDDDDRAMTSAKKIRRRVERVAIARGAQRRGVRDRWRLAPAGYRSTAGWRRLPYPQT